jgi:hypothetical protein
MNYGVAYRQAFEMQLVLFRVVMDDATPPQGRALCARAWDVLEDRKRIIRGKPLPGAYRPENPRPKRKAYWSMHLQPNFASQE